MTTQTTDFTPNTDQVRAHYVFDQGNVWRPERGEAFDRWIAQRDGNGKTAAFFQVGTLVRLTGKSWDEYGIRGESVTVGVESFEGRRSENFFAHNGQHFILLKTDTEDYTATAILPTIGDKR